MMSARGLCHVEGGTPDGGGILGVDKTNGEEVWTRNSELQEQMELDMAIDMLRDVDLVGCSCVQPRTIN